MKVDYRTVALLVAVGLVVVLVIAVVGAIVLATQDKDLPQAIASRLDAILVGLLGLLAKSPNADEVTIVNKPNDPVPTTEAGHIDVPTALLAAAVAFIVTLIVNAWVFDLNP